MKNRNMIFKLTIKSKIVIFKKILEKEQRKIHHNPSSSIHLYRIQSQDTKQ